MLQRFLFLLWVPVAVVACFVFASEHAEAEEALASWYGPGFSGLPTASGESYDPSGFTAAHKTMPLGTELLVSYEGSAVEVTVNDRGPYVGDRELDLSQGAAEVLGLTEAGVDYVDYTPTGAYAAAAPQDASVNQYASTTSQETYSSVSTQYSVEGEVIDDQYAGAEQYPIEAAVEPVAPVAEAPVATPPVAEAPVSDPSSAVTGTTVSGSVLVVRPGETLSSIAAEAGVSEYYLACRNAVGDPNYIYAGQVLYY